MPKNKGKGNKITKRGRASSDEKRSDSPIKEEDQEYMKVVSILGNCRVELEDQYNRKYMGIIRGKMKKRVYVKNRDLVLVSIREFQDGKVDILHKYGHSEILYLIRKSEINNDFVDIDTMFSDSTYTKSRKISVDNSIDLPPNESDNESDNEGCNSDNENKELYLNEHSHTDNENEDTDSELDFDNI